MNNLVNNLRVLLNKNSEDIAAVLQLLNDVEKTELLQKLEGLDSVTLNIEELRYKSEAIISLLMILLDNPRLKVELRNDKASTELINKLKEVAYRISKGYLEFSNDENKNYWLVITSLLALIADRTPEIDILIKKRCESINIEFDNPSESDLENIMYLFILKLIKRIESNTDVTELRSLITKSENILATLQDQQINQENVELGSSLYISGIANILYVLKAECEYLLTGNLLDQTSDIDSLIDSYCFNALKLFSSEQKNLYTVSSLLRPAMKQLVANSIWRVTARSPILKDYFLNNLSLGKDLILTFLPSQRDSILDLLTAKKSIILNMPTSSGKSLMAELYILFTLHNFRTARSRPTVAYVVPTNALTNQVFHRLTDVLNGFDYRIETALPYYQVDEIEEEILTLNHIDILITTPEKLDFLVRKAHPSLQNLKLVVVDEAHNISDANRGAKLELLLATIKQRRQDVNYLLLSPFIKNGEDIATWLAGSEDETGVISVDWAPTKQFIGCNLLKLNKTKSSVTYLPSGRNDIVKEPIEVDLQLNPQTVKTQLNEERIDTLTKTAILLQRYLKIGSVMVLCTGAETAQKSAIKLLPFLTNKRLISISRDTEIEEVIELVKQESEEDNELIECLKYGVGFHHARMPAIIKEAIERLIRHKKVKLIFATTTLAQGMNFPITTVIFNSLHLGGGSDSRNLTNAEFWNIAGRAGRAFMDQEGHVITPYVGSQQHSLEVTKNYVTGDIAEIISSLNNMLRHLDSQEIFEYRFIKDNPTTSTFFQYLSHILNVTYDYNLNSLDTTRIRNILNSSLFFNRLSFEEGFIEAQERISNFAFRYVNHLRDKRKGDLKLADLFGVSDITFNKFRGALYAYKQQIIEEHGEASVSDFLQASKIILTSKDNTKLAEIVRLVAQLPEINLALFNRGSFNPESIAKIIIGWVNGKKINQIVDDIAYEDSDRQEVLGRCNHYVNSNLKSFVPWGLSIFQTLTDDITSDDAKNLPSYIYYGVNNKESVILSKAGVPRFAVESVKTALTRSHSNLALSVENMSRIKQAVKGLSQDAYSALNGDASKLKSIVDSNL